MGDVPVPLHLAVHVLGLTVALGLAGYAVISRRDAGSAWPGLATGGVLLALSHVVLGSGVAGDTTWPLYVRVGAYAAIAVAAAGRSVGTSAPVVVAASPVAAQIAAAVAGLAAAVASLRGVLARSQSTLLLAVGLVLWAVADVLASEVATLAAVVSVAGSVAVAGWLSGRARERLMTRFLTAFLLVLLVLVVALSAAGGVIFSADLEREQLERLEQVSSTRAQQWEQDWPRELQAIAGAFTSDRIARELQTAAEEGASLDGRAATIAQLPGVDIVLLVTVDGAVAGSRDALRGGPLSRSDELLVAGHPAVTRALTGATTASPVALGQRDLVVVSAAPVVPTVDGEERNDLRRGVVVVGRRVTDPRVLAAIVSLTGADATVLVGGGVAASTLPAPQHDELTSVVAERATSRTVTLDDAPRFLAVEAIEDADGQPIAELVLTLDASSVADVEQDLVRSLFWGVILGLAVAAALAAIVARRISRPVQELTAAAEQVAGGDLDTSVVLDQPDEIGRLADAFNHMTISLREREQDLVTAAATEAELRGQLEVVTASMGEALIAADPDGRVRTANPAACDLLDTPRDQLLGARLNRVLRGLDDHGVPILDALGRPDEPGTAALRGAVGRGRRSTPVAATAAPLLSQDGTRLGRVYVLRDITGEVEVERMKTEFLSNISHELRTPLTPIKGYAEVMRAKELSHDRVVHFAGTISESARRLERIIAMLVDFAALEAGRMEINLAPTPVGPEVDRVLARWREREPDRRFTRRLERGLPPVQVDPDLLIRVLEELIDNAVKFSEDPIRIRGNDEGDGRVRLTVADTGSGIEEDELETILRDFHQADGSATRRYGGLGLGMSIVQRIVERFNGDIVIESELGEGTEVHLLLPVAEADRA